MKLAWSTDIHLDRIKFTHVYDTYCAEINDSSADALVITGDIATSHRLENYILGLADDIKKPIYFILGNHDYYGNNIAHTREAVKLLLNKMSNPVWLTSSGVIPLTEKTCLIGHDSWADGRYGDYRYSRVSLLDYERITDFLGLGKYGILTLLNRLGDEAAHQLEPKLIEAVANYNLTIVAMHAPPFVEASWYDGKPSNDNWLPHFTCKAVGDLLLDVAEKNPNKTILVLCGHTHGGGHAKVLPNLHIETGAAIYGAPAVNMLFEFE